MRQAEGHNLGRFEGLALLKKTVEVDVDHVPGIGVQQNVLAVAVTQTTRRLVYDPKCSKNQGLTPGYIQP